MRICLYFGREFLYLFEENAKEDAYINILINESIKVLKAYMHRNVSV